MTKRHPKPQRTWILVASASKAFILEREDQHPDLAMQAQFEDPLGRAKGSDLVSDRDGYESVGPGRGSAAYSPKFDPRTKEHERFARRLAAQLNEAVSAHRCEALAVLSSNPFLGEVKSHLDRQALGVLRSTVPIDLTHLSGAELSRRVLAEIEAPA